MIFQHSYNDVEKEVVIASALETEEGRVALAQAMVEPIKRSLEYQAIGRKLIMVDELPQGELARYEKDVASVASVISRQGAVPDRFVEGEEVLVPTFEIGVNPTIRLSEIKARRFYIVDRAQMKAKEAIQKAEDTEILAAIDASVPSKNNPSHAGELSVATLNYLFSLIEEHDLTVAKIVVHPTQYADIRNWGKDVFDEATRRDVLLSGLFGHLWTSDIHVSHRVPPKKVYVLAPAEYVGAMPVRQDITVLPADDPKLLRLGWVIFEEVGITILNDYATGRIDLDLTS
jgi:hypothetical protein